MTPVSSGDLVRLARTNAMHYTAQGAVGLPLGDADSSSGGASFENAMLKALDGVNAYQNASSSLLQRMTVAPDSVDAHDVTIAMAEANLSLNIARAVLDRVVRGWKEVINTR